MDRAFVCEWITRLFWQNTRQKCVLAKPYVTRHFLNINTASISVVFLVVVVTSIWSDSLGRMGKGVKWWTDRPPCTWRRPGAWRGQQRCCCSTTRKSTPRWESFCFRSSSQNVLETCCTCCHKRYNEYLLLCSHFKPALLCDASIFALWMIWMHNKARVAVGCIAE